MLESSHPERRQGPRRKALIPATILFDNGRSAFDCLIRNLSDKGAKLTVSGPIGLPDCFDLAIPQKNVTRRVRVIWRRADEIGVSFEAGDLKSGDTPDGEAALKRRIKALLRKAAERTVTGLWSAIGRLLDAFTPDECANYFEAAGDDAT